MSQSNDATRVSLWPCVLSYPKLFVPESSSFDDSGDKEPQYSAEFWVYSNDPRYGDNLNALNAAVEAAKLAKWGPGAQINPHTFKHPIKALSTKNNPPPTDGLYVRANTRNRPSVIKRDMATGSWVPVEDQEEAYAGVIVGAALNASAFEIKGPGGSITSRGVKFYVNQVLLIKNGERLGRETSTPEETFGSALQQMQFEQINTATQAAVAAQMAPPQFAPAMPQMPGMPQAQPAPQQYAQPAMPQMPGYPQPGMPHPMMPMPGYPGYPQQ